MTFCPRCNTPTKDTMKFCTKCGNPLKQTTNNPNQTQPQTTTPPPTQESNQQTREKEELKNQQATNPKQGRGERGAISCLIGGLILITLGAFAVMQISNPNAANTGQNWAIMLLLIGVIIITGAIYIALTTQHPKPPPTTPTPKTYNNKPKQTITTETFHTTLTHFSKIKHSSYQ